MFVLIVLILSTLLSTAARALIESATPQTHAITQHASHNYPAATHSSTVLPHSHLHRLTGVCGLTAADVSTEDLVQLAAGAHQLLGADDEEKAQIAAWIAKDCEDLAALEKDLTHVT